MAPGRAGTARESIALESITTVKIFREGAMASNMPAPKEARGSHLQTSEETASSRSLR